MKPILKYYHPNGKGTGAVVGFEMNPAEPLVDGYIKLSIAPQKTCGGNGILPEFDLENEINVNLSFNDICLMLQVFRGECESINEGRGSYIRAAGHTSVVKLDHVLDPYYGYRLTVTRNEKMYRIFFSPTEALGLCESMCGSMVYLAFGIPSCAQEK